MSTEYSLFETKTEDTSLSKDSSFLMEELTYMDRPKILTRIIPVRLGLRAHHYISDNPDLPLLDSRIRKQDWIYHSEIEPTFLIFFREWDEEMGVMVPISGLYIYLIPDMLLSKSPKLKRLAEGIKDGSSDTT